MAASILSNPNIFEDQFQFLEMRNRIFCKIAQASVSFSSGNNRRKCLENILYLLYQKPRALIGFFIEIPWETIGNWKFRIWRKIHWLHVGFYIELLLYITFYWGLYKSQALNVGIRVLTSTYYAFGFLSNFKLLKAKKNIIFKFQRGYWLKTFFRWKTDRAKALFCLANYWNNLKKHSNIGFKTI